MESEKVRRLSHKEEMEITKKTKVPLMKKEHGTGEKVEVSRMEPAALGTENIRGLLPRARGEKIQISFIRKEGWKEKIQGFFHEEEVWNKE